MAKKILVSCEGGQTRVAMLEDGRLVNIEMEGGGASSIKGNIYKARVVSLNSSLQAAFVDFGGEREGFLSVQDIGRPLIQDNGKTPNINSVLKENQELTVQVLKDPINKKGATLTTSVSLPGRFMVLVPGGERVGVSRKISDEDRQRVKDVFSGMKIPEGFGVIARTASESIGRKQELSRDLSTLLKLWEKVEERAQKNRAPALLFHDQNVAIRYLREYFSTEVDEVWIDEKSNYEAVLDFFVQVMPRYRNVVKLYDDYLPLFSKFDVESQIGEIFSRRVNLPSGGSIVLDRTEALVAIDVNSGKIREKNVENTAFRTNQEAAKEIARQVILRDLAGLIVIDFIDMEKAENTRKVEQELRLAFEEDKAKLSFSSISRFGLMELSRQKIRQDVYQGTFQPCPYCNGTGTVRSPEFLALEVLRRLREIIARHNPGAITVELPVDVCNNLQNRMRRTLAEWEESKNVRIELAASTEVSAHEIRFKYGKRTSEDGADAHVTTADLWQGAEGASTRERVREAAARDSARDGAADAPRETAKEPAREGAEAPRERSGRSRGGRRRGGGGGARPEAQMPPVETPLELGPQKEREEEQEERGSQSGLLRLLGKMLGIPDGPPPQAPSPVTPPPPARPVRQEQKPAPSRPAPQPPRQEQKPQAPARQEENPPAPARPAQRPPQRQASRPAQPPRQQSQTPRPPRPAPAETARAVAAPPAPAPVPREPVEGEAPAKPKRRRPPRRRSRKPAEGQTPASPAPETSR